MCASGGSCGDDATTADLDEGITGDEPFYLLLWDESAQTIIYWNGGPDGAIDGWINTNGAPIPGLNDPSVVYDFSTDDYEPNCNDPQACNFDPSATVNVGCLYAEFGYDCDGNCLADADGDGVCNPFEVTGCTNLNACNYNPAATEETVLVRTPISGTPVTGLAWATRTATAYAMHRKFRDAQTRQRATTAAQPPTMTAAARSTTTYTIVMATASMTLMQMASAMRWKLWV